MKSPMIERDLLVFSIWALFGLAAIAFLLEGFSRDSYALAAIGVAFTAAGFIAHIIVNAVFACGFSRGETALGVGAFGILAAAFIASWIDGGLSLTDYWSGLTFFAVLVLGLFVYLSTRYGMRGAFSHLHNRTAASRTAHK